MEKTTQKSTDKITISMKEYLSLKEDSDWLLCLESAGVDNWPGIEFAYQIKDEGQ